MSASTSKLSYLLQGCGNDPEKLIDRLKLFSCLSSYGLKEKDALINVINTSRANYVIAKEHGLTEIVEQSLDPFLSTTGRALHRAIPAIGAPITYEFIVGRSPNIQAEQIPLIVKVSDNNTLYVSRTHCKIQASQGKLFLEDLESFHGTFLQGKRVFTKTEIQLGDQIQLSKRFLFAVDRETIRIALKASQ
jgi:hypothetical protein